MHVRALSFIAILLFGCSSEVTRASSESSSGATGSSSTSSSSSSSSHAASSSGAGGAGAGGGFVSSSSGAGGFGTSSGTGGAHPACNQGTLDITGDGPPQHYTLSCKGGWGANWAPTVVGYHDPGGGGFVGLLDIEGCLSGNPAMGELFLQAVFSGTQQSMAGGGDYVDPTGVSFFADPKGIFALDLVNDAAMIGDYYDGSFKADFTNGKGAFKHLSGSFHACRVEDALPKP